MRIAITGASGFIGTAAGAQLAGSGHVIVPMRRTGAAPGSAHWDPATGAIDAQALGRIDALLHLAGENVAAGRWNPARRRAIAASRGPATLRLCESLAALPEPPKVMVSASAVGIYGDRGDTELDEDSPPGEGFLAEVARAWEAATAPLQARGTRVVHLRIGVVLGQGGGALAKMLPMFRLGLGGPLGTGRQWMSWIGRDDLVAAIALCLADPGLRGPVLATAPQAVTNREFTHTLGRVLRRPAILPVPRLALRLLLGEMADAMLLASQRAVPRRLPAAGFAFAQPALEPALRAALGLA